MSSYDLGEEAELVLISWSTIGLELARMGAPVLVAFNGRDAAIPRDDFHEWAATPAEYFEKLRELLDRPGSLERVARAFRWYSLHTLGTTIDLSDVVPRSDFGALPDYRTPREAAAIERIVMGGEDVCDLNIERLRSSQTADSRAREFDELRRQLRRLVHFLLTGEESAEDRPLVVRSRDRLSKPGFSHLESGNDWKEKQPTEFENGGRNRHKVSDSVRVRSIELEGFDVEYRDGGRLFRRHSPMAARLATLCGQPAPEPAPFGAAR